MSLTVSASGITFDDLTTLSTASISASNIAANAITSVQLSANAVTASKIASGAVTTDKIALGAVITQDIANGAVTAAKLNGGQSGSAPIYGCRAWVNFDGTRNASGGSDTANTNRFIRSSGNVTSVLRNGTGDYTVNFTTPMADANYSVSGSVNGTFTGGLAFNVNAATVPTTNAVRVMTDQYSAGALDRTYVSVAIFGN
ncbi:MAG: hypothetical protein EB127_08240 [Alphaproteobacteria bacterium]|nr:hypothetical protein [Alphaproteobacteria bacterium]